MLEQRIKNRFMSWWNNENTDRPMIRLYVEKENPDKSNWIDWSKYNTHKDFHISPFVRNAMVRNGQLLYDFHYECFPYIDINMGPGSMAGYLGLDPQYQADTVWYNHIHTENLSDIPKPKFNPNNKIFLEHCDVVKKAVELANGDFFVAIPDILENIDILALLRGNEPVCYDLMDCEDTVMEYLNSIQDIYMDYYDKMYELTRHGKECCYTAFSIWGPNKIAKIQCDFSCLLSCGQFDDFVLPYLERQTLDIPYTMYHLDGKDAVRHVKSVMSLKELNALQWTAGAGQHDGGSEEWYPIYDQVIEANKSLWISFDEGSIEDMVMRAKKIAKRYDNKGLYFHFPPIKRDKLKLFEDAFGKMEK